MSELSMSTIMAMLKMPSKMTWLIVKILTLFSAMIWLTAAMIPVRSTPTTVITTFTAVHSFSLLNSMLPYYSTGSVLNSTVCIRNDRIADKLPYMGPIYSMPC